MQYGKKSLEQLLKKYGLCWSIPSPPHDILRIPLGKEFLYKQNNEVVEENTRVRCESLAVAPVWTDVWYSEDKSCHVQATAVDGSGKKTVYLSLPTRTHS